MLYEKLNDYCYRKRTSIKRLEAKAGLANGTIGKWKHGKKPSLDSLMAVSDVTGIKLGTLIKLYREDFSDVAVGQSQSEL